MNDARKKAVEIAKQVLNAGLTKGEQFDISAILLASGLGACKQLLKDGHIPPMRGLVLVDDLQKEVLELQELLRTH